MASSFNTNEELKDLITPESKDSNKYNISSDIMPKSGSSVGDNNKENINSNTINNIEEQYQKNNNDQSSSLYILEITNATGTKGTLTIYPNTIPEEMAFTYSKQYNLNYQTMKEIEEAIKKIHKQLMMQNKQIPQSKINNQFSDQKEMRENKMNQSPYFSKEKKRPLSTRIIPKQNKLEYTIEVKKQKLQKRYIDDKTVNLGIYLYNKGQKQQEKVNKKLKAIKQQLDSEMNSNLTFKPQKFTSNSSYHTLPNPKSDHLSKIDKIKQERNSIMPFKPSINNNYFIKESFQERLIKYKSKTNQNKKKIENEVHCNYDRLGQELFKPKLISKNLIKRTNNNVFELNYDFASYYQRDKAYLLSLKNKEESRPIKCSHDTDVIFKNKKIKAFKKIFSLLDSDKDDSISFLNINSKRIPESIKKIIQPIIDEIINQQVTIFQMEFIQAMDLFFVYLDIKDKWAILNIKKVISNTSKTNLNMPLFTFRPDISLSQKNMNRCSSAV